MFAKSKHLNRAGKSPFKGECCPQMHPYLFSRILDFLAVLFTFLGELQLWFANLQLRIKVMLMFAFLSVQANSVS